MLKSGIRSGGIAARVNQSFHSRGRVRCGGAGLRRAAHEVERGLVEAEVVDLGGDLAVLDEVDAVAGQAGEQHRLRVDLAHVPEAGQQQPPLRRGDHVLERGVRPAGEQEVLRRRGEPGAVGGELRGRRPRVGQLADPALAQPLHPPRRRAVVEHRHLVAGARRREHRFVGQGREARGVRIPGEGERQRGELLADPRAARAGERAAALLRGPPAHRPRQVDHEVADRRRRQDRLVTAGLDRDPPPPPRQPPPQVGEQRRAGRRR